MGDLNLRQPVAEPGVSAVLAQLEKVLADGRFAGSPSLTRFLRYTVAETLAGRTDDLREGPLGLSVFDRGQNFDSRIDPIVRVQARKLRARLHDYYEHEGAADAIRIDLPKGSYVPRFVTGVSMASPSSPAETAPVSAEGLPPSRRRSIGLLAGAAATVITVLALIWSRGRPSPAETLELSRLTYEAGSTMSPVLSRDGKLFAYSSDRGKGDLNIWLQPVHGGAPLQLTRQESPALTPDFSPDGMWIAFRTRHSGGGIAVVSVLGGEERRITDTGWLPRYSPDGAWIAYTGNSSLGVVPSTGGPSRVVASEGIAVKNGPLWASGGKHLLALAAPRSSASAGNPFDWYAIPWTGGTPVSVGLRKQVLAQGLPELTDDAGPGDWLGDSIVFTMRSGNALNVWKVPVNPRTLRVTGPVVQLTSGSNFVTPRSSLAGQIVFYNEIRMTHIYRLAVDKLGRALGLPEQLTEDSSLMPRETRPRLSGDGTQVAYVSTRTGVQQVVLRDLASGKESAVVTPVRQDLPLITGDGAMMVYQSGKPDQQILSIPKQRRPAIPDAGETWGSVQDWSSDGRTVLVEAPSRAGLMVWNRDSGKQIKWLEYRAGSLLRASLSADRKWVALVFSDSAGGFVAPLSPAPATMEHLIRLLPGTRITSLHWSADRSLLYYFAFTDDHNCLWAQGLNPATGQAAGAPFPVYHFHNNRLAPWGDSVSAGAGLLVLPLTELRSDIWMAAPTPPKGVTATRLR